MAADYTSDSSYDDSSLYDTDYNSSSDEDELSSIRQVGAFGTQMSPVPKLSHIPYSDPETALDDLIHTIRITNTTGLDDGSFAATAILNRIKELVSEIPDTSLAYAEAIRQRVLPTYDAILRSKVKSFDLALEAAAEIGDLQTAIRLAPRVSGGLSLAAAAALGNGHDDIYEVLLPRITRPDIVLYGAVRGGNLNSVKTLLNSINNLVHIQEAFMYACRSGHIDVVETIYERLTNAVNEKRDLAETLYRGFHAALEAKQHMIAKFVLNIMIDFNIMSDMHDELIVAIDNGYLDIIEQLIPYVSNLHRPLDRVMAKGYVDIMNQFLELLNGEQIHESALYKAVSLGATNIEPYIDSNIGKLAPLAFKVNNIPVLQLLFKHQPQVAADAIIRYIHKTDKNEYDHLIDIYDVIITNHNKREASRLFASDAIRLNYRHEAEFFLQYVSSHQYPISELIYAGWYDLIIALPKIELNDNDLILKIFETIFMVEPKTAIEATQITIILDRIIQTLPKTDLAYEGVVLADNSTELAIKTLTRLASYVQDPDVIVIDLMQWDYKTTIGKIAIFKLLPYVKDPNKIMERMIFHLYEDLALNFVNRVTDIYNLHKLATDRKLTKLADALIAAAK